MWLERISLDLRGESFVPSDFLKHLKTPATTSYQHEPNNPDPKQPSGFFGFGSLSLLCPSRYGVQHLNHVAYEDWYPAFLQAHRELIVDHKVTSTSLFIEIFHDEGQLNTEIFSPAALKTLGEFNVALPFSYYRLRREQLTDMLSKTDLSPEQIDEYLAEHPIGA